MAYTITTKDLRKAFGRVVAVDNLNLQIPKGAIFGLLGPNGAGKSTTFGILAGWLIPDSGHATVLDTPSHKLHRLGGRVAALPQDALFPPQIEVGAQLAHFARLMGMSGTDAQNAAQQALKRVSLQDIQHRRGSELSHGMNKRVGIAQTLLGNPEVIFLDEPTAGLDPNSAREIKDLISSLSPQATLVVSSHNLSEIQEVCTHGAIMDHGRVTISGTIEDLTRQTGEITVEIKKGHSLPLVELRRAFGEDNIHLLESSQELDLLRITFSSKQEISEVISSALGILLGARTPILGVRRGTSLESAFIELTRSSPT